MLPGTSPAQQPAEPAGDSSQAGDTKADETKVKVFSLANPSSRHLLDILQTLFDNETGGVAVDEQNNTAVVKARPDVLHALEAVLQRIEQQPPSPNRFAPSAQADTGVPPNSPAAREAIRINSEVPGVTTIRSLVANGAAVRNGDLLVELDDSHLTDEAKRLLIEMAEIKNSQIARQGQQGGGAEDLGVYEAELRVTDLRRKHLVAEMQIELTAAQREIDIAKQALNVALARKERLDELIKSGKGGTTTESEDASLEVAKAEAEVELATARRKLLEEHTQPLQLAELKLEELRATAELNQARVEQNLTREQGRAELSALEQQLRLNIGKLARIENQRANCKIYAPSDGVVRYPGVADGNSMIAAGRQVREGQTVLLLYPVN